MYKIKFYKKSYFSLNKSLIIFCKRCLPKLLSHTFAMNVQEFILRSSHKYATMSFECQIHKRFFFVNFAPFIRSSGILRNGRYSIIRCRRSGINLELIILIDLLLYFPTRYKQI